LDATYTQNNTNIINAQTDIHVFIGFEPTIPALLRAKRVHALDRDGTVIGSLIYIVFILF
jgi:hypothetical protein